jgi:transposase
VLVELLERGLSLAAIGDHVGLDESTVGYWAKKYGLTAVNARKHAGRGGIDRDVLEQLLERGMSIRAIANELDFSPSTVRHWIGRHGLSTRMANRLAAGREAKANGFTTAELECGVHGPTAFRLAGRRAFRCLACRQERVARRRRQLKETLVAEAGGACVGCGYDAHLVALQFHHLDPATKEFGIAAEGITRSLDSLRREAAKCALVCANCHAELEAGVRTLRLAADKVVDS